MKNKLLLYGYFLLLSSCASLFNGPNSSVDIHTSEPATIIVNKDTFYTESNKVLLSLERKKQTIAVTAFTDSITKVIDLDPQLSPAFFMNIIWPYAFLFERNKQKFYTYPNSIFLNMADTIPHYFWYNIPEKNELYFSISLPYINSYFFQPINDDAYKSRTGFLGFGLGIEYFYKKNRFWTLSVNASNDGIVSDRNENFYAVAFSFSNNHRRSRFTYGYGLSYAINSWNTNRFLIEGPPESFFIYVEKENHTLGANFSIYRQLKDNFYLGLVYRPTVFQVAPDVRLKYEHVIGVDLVWKLKIKQ